MQTLNPFPVTDLYRNAITSPDGLPALGRRAPSGKPSPHCILYIYFLYRSGI